MDRQDLHSRLRQLRHELQQVETLDEGDRQALAELIGDVQELLQKKEGHDAPAYRRLRDRLKGSVLRFEVSHPRVTAVMEETIDTLVNMGI